MFTVSQYDSYSYLFYQPTFISLDPTVKPNNVVVKGIRIGINGTIPAGGPGLYSAQHHRDRAEYTPQGEVLSNVGTVIGLQNGPLTDQFFLQFDQLGTHSNAIVEPIAADAGAGPGAARSRTSGCAPLPQINSTLSVLTGVPTTNASVAATYLAVQQQLPSLPTLEGFSAANQVGVAQLAIQYCNVMVNTPSYAAQVLPGVVLRSVAVLLPGRHQCGHERAGQPRARVGSQLPAGALDGHHRTRQPDSQALQRLRRATTRPACRR